MKGSSKYFVPIKIGRGKIKRKKHEKLSRKEAIDSGQTKYWTGNPCANGHVCFRWVCNNGCEKCGAERSKEKALIKRRATKEAEIMDLKCAAEKRKDEIALNKELDYLANLDL